MLKIKAALERENHEIEIKQKSNQTVQSAFISFIGLLFELGLSVHANEKLSIKIDLDTNPPSGGMCETTVVRHYVPVNLFHYDKSSLFSGKINALLSRPYTKGRDIYDLIWFISEIKTCLPNFVFLNNALRQSGWRGDELSQDNWRSILLNKLNSLNWKHALNDVEPFLERKEDKELISRDIVAKLLTSHPLAQ